MGFLNKTGLEYFWSRLKEILSSKVNGVGVSRIRSLTQEEYDALGVAEKNDGTVYITDEGIDVITDEQIEALFEGSADEA